MQLHSGTLGNVLHVSFLSRCTQKLIFQHTINQLRRILPGGGLSVILILKQRLGGGKVLIQLLDQFFLFLSCRPVRMLQEQLDPFSGCDVTQIILTLNGCVTAALEIGTLENQPRHWQSPPLPTICQLPAGTERHLPDGSYRLTS